MKVKKQIPNFITSLNLVCGFIGIVFCFKNELAIASMFIWGGALLDFLDGLMARILKAYTSIGKELDSLADVVTFGVLPTAIIYMLLLNTTTNDYIPFIAVLVLVFSALRLAIFNTDTQQTLNFKGLPTPAAAIFVSSFPYIGNSSDFFLIFLVFTALVLPLLMVVNVCFLSLKFQGISFLRNKHQYFIIVTSLALLIIFKASAFFFIIPFYLIYSLLHAIVNKVKSSN